MLCLILKPIKVKIFKLISKATSAFDDLKSATITRGKMQRKPFNPIFHFIFFLVTGAILLERLKSAEGAFDWVNPSVWIDKRDSSFTNMTGGDSRSSTILEEAKQMWESSKKKVSDITVNLSEQIKKDWMPDFSHSFRFLNPETFHDSQEDEESILSRLGKDTVSKFENWRGWAFRDLPGEYLLIVETFGLPKNKLHVEESPNEIKINGSHVVCTRKSTEDKFNRVCFERKIFREFNIPSNVKSGETWVRYQDGLLIIHLPKITSTEIPIKDEVITGGIPIIDKAKQFVSDHA